MAASVRIEDEAFSDIRYEALARLCGLADADHARGKVARLWRQCTAEQRYVLSELDVLCVLGEKGPDALCTVRLGERVPDGIRIKGTDGRIEWLGEKRDGAKAGGEARAASADRGPDGRMLPRQNGESSQRSPADSVAGPGAGPAAPAKPGPAAPGHSSAPAPAPVQLQERDIGDALRQTRELRPHEVEQVGFSQCGSLAGPGQVAIRKLMPIHRDELELALKAGGSSWKYTAKVLESMRAEERREHSPPPVRALTRTVSKQEQSIADMRAGAEAFNATRR